MVPQWSLSNRFLYRGMTSSGVSDFCVFSMCHPEASYGTLPYPTLCTSYNIAWWNYEKPRFMVPLANSLRLKSNVDVEPSAAEDKACLLIDQVKHVEMREDAT